MNEIAMQQAISAAKRGVFNNDGGPYGAAIVHNNKIIAVTHNTVLRDKDPSCHAEINAIRIAAKYLNTHILEECVLYTTAEPCPMCLGAIFWARIPEVAIGVTKECAEKFGFDDKLFYKFTKNPSESKACKFTTGLLAIECESVFKFWQDRNGQIY